MGKDMADSELNTVLLALGKAQVNAMFRRQEAHAVDDSEFLPLLEVVLTAFEGIEKEVAEEVWEYTFAVYDRACKQADPTWTTAENRKLMQKYLLGPRGLKRKPRRRKD
jgi:4-hydroxy-3-methylbut-2-enyl diphosphate reductase IspH